MRPPHLLLVAACLPLACGDSGGAASLPSSAKGDMCLLPAFQFDDARKCARRQIDLPVCFRYEKVAVNGLDWMCMVSPTGKLYLYPSEVMQVFYYPGWTFGPATRTARQPAFESTLAAADETRCQEALVVRAQAGQDEPPYNCVDPPGTLAGGDWPFGSVALTAHGASFTAKFLADVPWTTDSHWTIELPLTWDPSYANKGLFGVRWPRRMPAPAAPHTYTCDSVEFGAPGVPPIGEHESLYDWQGGGNPCPRAPTCQVTVTKFEGDEGYPVAGKFTARNVTRGAGNCSDTVDLDGSFTVKRPEL